MSLEALITYYKDSRPSRFSPYGKFDSGNRWYPDNDAERCSCCENIRKPSRAYPFSLLTHCRSQKHIKERLLTKPTEEEKEAIAMTMEKAALAVCRDNILLKEVAKIMLRT